MRGQYGSNSVTLCDIDMYELKIDAAFHDQVLIRVEKLDRAAYTGFVMPKLKLIKKKKLSINENTPILEIGSGPVGILTFLKSNYRYALDPLEYYRSCMCSISRLPRIHSHHCREEQLLFSNAQFQRARLQFAEVSSCL